MEDLFTAISNFGFPIVVAAYLLVRFEKKIDDLNNNISGRGGLIDRLEELVNLISKKNNDVK